MFVGSPAVAEISYKIGSVRPSILPFVLLSRCFLGIVLLVFSEIWLGARNSYEVLHDSWIFREKFFLLQNWERGHKMGQKQGFFNLLENLLINIYWIWSVISCTNPILGTIFVPEIWAKMFSANQIAGYFNQPYLQNKSMQ